MRSFILLRKKESDERRYQVLSFINVQISFILYYCKKPHENDHFSVWEIFRVLNQTILTFL